MVCNQTIDNKIGRLRKRESDLFVTGMITDRIGRHEVLLPISHKSYNFRGKRNSQVMKERVNLHYKTIIVKGYEESPKLAICTLVIW